MTAADDVDQMVSALIGLIGALNNPRQDDVLLREARVDIDRALFPLLVRLDVLGAMGVAELADQAGRDHTTISRQLGVLESQGLVRRRVHPDDGRVRQAVLTPRGRRVANSISDARRRLLGRLLADWSAAERKSFAALAQKMADGMRTMRESDTSLT